MKNIWNIFRADWRRLTASVVAVVVLLAVVMFFLDIVIPLSCASIFVCFGSCRHQSLDFYPRDRQPMPFIRHGQVPRIAQFKETDSCIPTDAS